MSLPDPDLLGIVEVGLGLGDVERGDRIREYRGNIDLVRPRFDIHLERPSLDLNGERAVDLRRPSRLQKDLAEPNLASPSRDIHLEFGGDLERDPILEPTIDRDPNRIRVVFPPTVGLVSQPDTMLIIDARAVDAFPFDLESHPTARLGDREHLGGRLPLERAPDLMLSRRESCRRPPGCTLRDEERVGAGLDGLWPVAVPPRQLHRGRSRQPHLHLKRAPCLGNLELETSRPHTGSLAAEARTVPLGMLVFDPIDPRFERLGNGNIACLSRTRRGEGHRHERDENGEWPCAHQERLRKIEGIGWLKLSLKIRFHFRRGASRGQPCHMRMTGRSRQDEIIADMGRRGRRLPKGIQGGSRGVSSNRHSMMLCEPPRWRVDSAPFVERGVR